MLVKRCDRCGKIYEPDLEGYKFVVAKDDEFQMLRSEPEIKADLCDGCRELLDAWFKYKE